MGEGHGSDISETPSEGTGDDVGDGGNEGRGEERVAESSFIDLEFRREKVDDDRAAKEFFFSTQAT
jgi:hypothetical protein